MNKKILLVSNMYPSTTNPEFGVFVEEVENDLISLGHTVDRSVISIKTKSKLNKIGVYILFYITTFFKVILNKYDYIYVHFISHSSLPLLVLKAFGFNVKIASHIHGGDVKLLQGRNKLFFKLKQAIVKWAFASSDVLVFPSTSYMEEVSKLYTLNESMLKSVYPSGGLPDEFFIGKFKCNKSNLLLGYAGRLVKSKNVDKILMAISRIDNVKLQIVGDGEEKLNLINMVDLLELSERVDFIPAKPKKDLIDWYRSVDIIVYPSESESLGLVPLESMACGCIPILSDIPVFREFENLGLSIFIIDHKNTESIVNAINYIDKMTLNARLRVRNINREVVKSKFSKETVREMISNVFK